MEFVDHASNVALGYVLLDHEYQYTVRHPIKKAIICEIIGAARQVPELRRNIMVQAALTSNISMIQLQEEMHGQSEELSLSQQGQVFTHPHRSALFLENAGITDSDLITFVRQHHEKNDGSGYPYRLNNESILLESKIISLSDKFCALLTANGYRDHKQGIEVLRNLLTDKSDLHDEILTHLLLKEVTVLPPGTVVKLSSEEIGVVIKHQEDELTKPFVNALKKVSGSWYAKPCLRDTSSPHYSIKGILSPSTIDDTNISLRFLFSGHELNK